MKGNLKTIVKKIERSGSLPPMPEAEFDKLAASLPKNEQGLIIRDALDAVDKQEYDELTILFDNYYTNTRHYKLPLNFHCYFFDISRLKFDNKLSQRKKAKKQHYNLSITQ